MKHIKIFEEFALQPGEEYTKLRFTTNEINLLKTKGILSEYGIGTYFQFSKIEKTEDGYFVVDGSIKCVNIADMIKACNDLLKELPVNIDQDRKWLVDMLNRSKIKYSKIESEYYLYDMEYDLPDEEDKCWAIYNKDGLYLSYFHTYSPLLNRGFPNEKVSVYISYLISDYIKNKNIKISTINSSNVVFSAKRMKRNKFISKKVLDIL